MKTLFRNKKRIIIAVIILELVLLVLNAFRFNRNESYSFSQDDLLLENYNYETKAYDHISGFYAEHSTISEAYIVTPPMHLKKGIYNVAVTYESNADDNWHACYTTLDPCKDLSQNRTANLVYSDHVAMPGDRNVVTYDSWVRYGTDFEVRLGPDSSIEGDNIYVLAQGADITYLRGRTIIYETTKLFLAFLVITILLYLILIKKEETKRFFEGKALTFAVLLFTILFSSYPLLGKCLYFGDDIHYHLRRIAFMGDAILSGQFPVHILPGWDNGYGYAAGVGYGDLLLYPSAILVMLGFTIQASYKFFIVFINALTALVAYYSFGKIADDKKVGLASSVLFTLIGFRLHSVYSGATVGEFSAFTFLPLILLGLWEIYNKKDKNAYIKFALGVTLTLSCHVLSTFILALVIPLFCLVLIEKTFRKEVLISLFKALAAIVVLNLHFIVPLADYMISKDVKGNTVHGMLWNSGRDLVTFFSYFQASFFDTGGFLGLGLPFLAILSVVLGFIICGKFKDRTWAYTRLLILSLVFVFLSTNSMFYYILMQDAPVIYKLLGNMQFPWHFLNVSCAMTVFWFAITMGDVVKDGQKRIAGFVAMAIICVFCVIQGEALLKDVVTVANPITMYDDAELSGPMSAEFSMAGIDQSLIMSETDMVIRDDVGATASIIKKVGTTIYAQVDNPTDSTVVTEAPLWGYRYYAAKAGGKKLRAFRADSMKVAVEIPAGYSGKIKIWYREPWSWRLAEILSLAALIYVIRQLFLEKK
ncbi:hypothetical protein D6853_01950 [Butyrivibrio sp. X503]|uniref:6-pyruvoyl-tetrahydropterin synthase-related protein n=1 Tax=Butyrivibrio sp. X503 TaxID=2364878 RepID=UPI000EA876DB|nr:6-pyruvoyl-tetrahydropterin synthase-related protein [Butyrivibrio sp. X503]RKM58318.1 hypothetical protein D6853_01950 [Butyrivibrio sp. X503]